MVKFKKDALIKNLVRGDKLVPHLERAILIDEPWSFEYTPKEGDDGWHPSGSCTPIASELYYLAAEHTDGEREDLSRLNKAFNVGHFWHQYLQFKLLRLGFADPEEVEVHAVKGWGEKTTFDVQREVDYKPFHWVSGSADALVSIPEHGQFIVDFKTMNSRDFNVNGLPDWVAAKYECQINIYMDLFDIDRALIVAINKDAPHGMREVEFERNQELIDRIYQKWEFVSACIEHKMVPEEDDDILFDVYPYLTGPVR